LRGAARLCLYAGVHRHRKHHRYAPIGDAALDFALDIVGQLAGTELGEIHAVRRAQAAYLPLVIRSLCRVAARLVDEAIPDIDIPNPCLLGATAVELVKIGGIRAGLGSAL